MGVNIKSGNNATGLANVSSNFELQVVTPQTQENAGFVQLSSEVDDGTVMGTRTTLALEASDDYRLRVGLDQTVFNLSFEGTNFPFGHLQFLATTQTTTLANGFLQLNAGSSTANTTSVDTRTLRHFPTFGTDPTYIDMWIKEANWDNQNCISEWGLLYLTTSNTQTPLDGVFFRRLQGGLLKAVINFGGVETEYPIDTTNVPARDGVGVYIPTEVHHYLIAYHNDIVRFWINDVLVASISCPSSQQSFTSSSNTPVGFRVWNAASGVISTARQLFVGYVNVGIGDQNTSKPWGHAMAGSGQNAIQTQVGSAAGQNANWTNSAAPTAFTASNIAAGYSTLGGQWSLAAIATNETDWAAFAFTVPAGTATLPGKTLYITGIRIGETVVTGAAAVNATYFFWAAAVGSSAVSLATADSSGAAASTHAPRRIALGGQAFTAAAPLGTVAAGFSVDFSSAPLVASAGSIVHVILKQVNGAATASLVWRGTVTLIGYWE